MKEVKDGIGIKAEGIKTSLLTIFARSEFSLDPNSEFPLNLNWKSEFHVFCIYCSASVDRRGFEEK